MVVIQKVERLMSLLSLLDFWYIFFRKSKWVISVASLQFSRFGLVPGSSLNRKVCCTRSCRYRLVSLIETWVKWKLLDTVMNCWIAILLTWHFVLRNSCSRHINVSVGMCGFIPHSIYCLLRWEQENWNCTYIASRSFSMLAVRILTCILRVFFVQCLHVNGRLFSYIN